MKLEDLKTAIVEEVQKAGRAVEDKNVLQTLAPEDRASFEQALEQLCEEGRLTVKHEKTTKAKIYDTVVEFMTPPVAKKENQWRPLRMTEEERAGRAFQAAMDKGPDPTRRMLAIPGHA